jgi:O-antigen/teichoic acid export membrane protein
MGWPLGYLLLAMGAGTAFFVAELATVFIMVLLTHFLLPTVGLTGAGVAYLIAYVSYLPLVYWLARHRTDFVWSGRTLGTAALLAALVALLAAVKIVSPNWLDFATSVALAAFGSFGLFRFHREGLAETLRKCWLERFGR